MKYFFLGKNLSFHLIRTLKSQENQRNTEVVSFGFNFVHPKSGSTILQTLAALGADMSSFQRFQGESGKS